MSSPVAAAVLLVLMLAWVVPCLAVACRWPMR